MCVRRDRCRRYLTSLLASFRARGSLSITTRASVLWGLLFLPHAGLAQGAPPSPGRPWFSAADLSILRDTGRSRQPTFWIDQGRTYSLAELIDLAQAHNPETHVAWQRARAQAAALGVARSELFPTLAAATVAEREREDILFESAFIRETVETFEIVFDLNYTVFDFGARAGRIDAARAELFAANFAFNDVHRRVIYQVAEAYYELLNAAGQEQAVEASLANAQTVQRAAEERLQQGLATLPDVLEARNATAQAQYQLQAVRGAEEIARGDLATSLGARPSTVIRVQPIDELSTPDSIGDTVDDLIERALEQRPDLMRRVADIRSAEASIKEARAAYFPNLTVNARPSAQSLTGSQPPFPSAHARGWLGGLSVRLNWIVFDGGARRRAVAQAEANASAAEAQVTSTRDQIANEVWTTYSQFRTALRQRQAAIALLQSADESYAAALESYNLGVRSLLDVTASQRALAEARAADVLARTQVLAALAELAFRTGNSIYARTPKPVP
jgi:outer membrane protein